MTPVHFVVPDLASPSGGNVYNRHLAAGLTRLGWPLRFTHDILSIPDGGLALVDGLTASAIPEVLVAQAHRLRLVPLMHMPRFTAAERAMLHAAAAIIVTSHWSASRLAGLDTHVAQPGVDPAPLVHPSETGERLLCVGAVTHTKGHDVLVEALTHVGGKWRCICVGPLDREPAFANGLSTLDGQVEFTGPIDGTGFYDNADLVILPSRQETYGMVVTEALARGIPVLATQTGGIPEALGAAPDGSPPGILVAPGDPQALAQALRRWLGDADLRDRLRRAALGRRTTLSDWTNTATVVSQVLTDASTNASVGR